VQTEGVAYKFAFTDKGHRALGRVDALSCTLAPLGFAFCPIPVRRPIASLHVSFPRSVTLAQLRFTSLSMI
jgi:hypothetical protein